ncbi:hypothetical protein ACFYO7_28515 [Nocardia salmonicida]|uniref:hypothetical protein n=1 Tax=Nocardia salmonicida TaxID=53431 RepID=UPI0036C021BE
MSSGQFLVGSAVIVVILAGILLGIVKTELRKRSGAGDEQVALGMTAAEVVALLGYTSKQVSTEEVLASYRAVVTDGKLPSQRFWSYSNKPRGYDTDLVFQGDQLVRVRQTSRRTGEIVRDEEMSDPVGAQADKVFMATRQLPPGEAEDIQRDFAEVADAWGAREVLVVAAGDLRGWIAKLLADNATESYTDLRIDMQASECPPRVQLFAISESQAIAGRPSARAYRIVRQSDGDFAVYGHPGIYR